VGYPLPYVNISIRSATGADCDAGEEGEVFISGPGVAAGYLHRYGANNDRFIDVCLPGNGATRAFRTGDIGVLDAAGGLRLLGRSDRQVKIHGHRIELDEVELAITALPSIQECAVVVSKERLIAHIVLDGSTIESTRRMVAKQLPPWMRPMAYVSHTSLPRTTSGKIDRNRL
jgi:acyl-coenzyme A synthetase/AMP-(fatty) acid ligase